LGQDRRTVEIEAAVSAATHNKPSGTALKENAML
jgi:hypothetical protein